jgi:hypothetical protein
MNKNAQYTPIRSYFYFIFSVLFIVGFLNKATAQVDTMMNGRIYTSNGEFPVRANIEIFRSQQTWNIDGGTQYAFYFGVNPDNFLKITPRSINTSHLKNGVTILDAALLSRHLLDVQRIESPYSLISGDVNYDGVLDALDVLIIRRFVLGLIPTFPKKDVWRFASKAHTFTDPTNPFDAPFPEILEFVPATFPFPNGDFVAMKIGDVNNSVDLTVVRGAAKPFNLLIEDKLLEMGKTYDIPVQVTPSVSAFQFSLNVDRNAAQIESVVTGDLPDFNENSVGLFKKEGILTAAWYNKTPNFSMEKETITLINLRIKPTITTHLSQILSLNSLYTEGVAYDAKDAALPVQLLFNSEKLGDNKAIILKNYPNPFSNETLLSFTLPEASTATLTVCDLLGKVLMTREQMFLKGLNEIPFCVKDAPSVSSGILIIRLQTAAGITEQKIVLNR